MDHTVLWITHIPLPMHGYGYECESTNLETFIHSTAEEHIDDLMDLFKVLRKYGLKLSPHKCQFFKKKIVYMELEFQIQGDKVCYTPLKDKCDAI